MTLLDQTQEEVAAAAFVIEGVNDDAGIEKVSSHSAADGPFQPPFAFLSEFLHPTSGSSNQFGVIFILPGSSQAFQCPDLLKAPKFLLSSLSKELSTPALADQSVNLADERFRDDDVCASGAHS
jgi:hypothetical protein